MQGRTALNLEALRATIGARWAAIDVVAETASTNADLLAAPDAADRSVLVAEHQVAGRGRLDRVWTSPPRAGLTFSVLLRPAPPMATWGWLPLLAGVALRSAVGDLTGVDAALKWPNDLLCGPVQGKAAGILAQASGALVVIGIGLNVSNTAAELPVAEATSLALCGAGAVDRTELLGAILSRLDAGYVAWSAADGDAEASGLADAYRAACATLGQRVTVALGDGSTLTGTASGVESDGRLAVSAGGIVHPVAAGDVRHLRPAG